MHKRTNRIAEESKQHIQRFKDSFDGWQHTMQKLERELSESFESRTGEAIVEKLAQERKQLRQEYESDFAQVIHSCRAHGTNE
ncbi:hypothetical protein [Listeria goaensis]|uniref:hypothetical protein n=1 Tax=Listeria goaensis TaxID=1649188 RepID=UPI0013C36216|nr:hypothetical protein [Listeria goaensis]